MLLFSLQFHPIFESLHSMHEISSGEMSIFFEDDELEGIGQQSILTRKKKGSNSQADRRNFKYAATSHIQVVHTTF